MGMLLLERWAALRGGLGLRLCSPGPPNRQRAEQRLWPAVRTAARQGARVGVKIREKQEGRISDSLEHVCQLRRGGKHAAGSAVAGAIAELKAVLQAQPSSLDGQTGRAAVRTKHA